MCVRVRVCVCDGEREAERESVCVWFSFSIIMRDDAAISHNGSNKVFCIKEAALAVSSTEYAHFVQWLGSPWYQFNHPHLFQREEIKIKLQIKMFVFSSSCFRIFSQKI